MPGICQRREIESKPTSPYKPIYKEQQYRNSKYSTSIGTLIAFRCSFRLEFAFAFSSCIAKAPKQSSAHRVPIEPKLLIYIDTDRTSWNGLKWIDPSSQSVGQINRLVSDSSPDFSDVRSSCVAVCVWLCVPVRSKKYI